MGANSNSPLVELKNLDYTFPDGEVIFKNVSLKVGAGEFVVLLGKNGSGKSTLINLVLGVYNPLNGHVNVFDMAPTHNRSKIFKKMFFNSHDFDFDENSRVGFILDNYQILYPDYDIEKEKSLLADFELDRDKCIHELSTGMKVRVQIIAAIASGTPLILIDEITAVLDRKARKLLGELLSKECASGRSVVMATNIPEDTTLNSNRVLTIRSHGIVDYEAA
ncbi:ATP-binding cassette domain-containing protein [Halobacteriovorax sp. HFRX-2_2]|uniref:ABC transporter ATP-binding protein n=1 Tax=unclassified Halobacteriovorax TaxID=2639665 RepID=UPI0037109730